MSKNQGTILLSAEALAHLYAFDYVHVHGSWSIGGVYTIHAPFDVAVTDVSEDGDGLPVATLVAVRS